MNNNSSYILAAIVMSIFLIFTVLQMRTGTRNVQTKEGSKLYNILRIIFAIPLFIIALVALILVFISVLT